MTANGTIYGIRFKRDGRTVYIGQTRQKPQRRWRQHALGKSPISEALRLLDEGSFEFFIVEQVPVNELNGREKHWITEAGSLYPNGLNHRPGGLASGCSTATRAKLSQLLKGKSYLSAEVRAKSSAAGKARAADPVFSAQMSVFRKARWQDETYRARISESRRETWSDPEYQEKISAARKAMWADPAHREAHSAKLKAAWARRRVNTDSLSVL